MNIQFLAVKCFPNLLDVAGVYQFISRSTYNDQEEIALTPKVSFVMEQIEFDLLFPYKLRKKQEEREDGTQK
jgi:hypothetical protein